MISIHNIYKKFDNVEVLKGINLEISDKSIFGLVGRSGTGKSTLLRCINGLESYDKGSIEIDGLKIETLKNIELRQLRKGIGMIFQQFSLLNRLTVYENIALPLKCWKYNENYTKQRVTELLDIVGIPEKINSRPNELSGGQKQRVAIARALTMNPKILLCDEATSALDPRTENSIIELLDKINYELGITIVIVTHKMSIVKDICSEVAILESGKLDAVGSVEKIFLDQPKSLINLTGSESRILLDEGINLELYFTGEQSTGTFISDMSRSLDISFSILNGMVERNRRMCLGNVLINIKDLDKSKVMNYLIANKIKYKIL